MAWFKVDDGLWRHRKLDALRAKGDERFAYALTTWTLMGSDCADQLSDGETSIARAARVTGLPRDTIELAFEDLVDVGLLDLDPSGYRLHDWLEYQPTRAEVEAKRAKRSESGRVGGTRSAASKRQANAQALATPSASLVSEANAQALASGLLEPCSKQTSTPSRPVPARPVPEKGGVSGNVGDRLMDGSVAPAPDPEPKPPAPHPSAGIPEWQDLLLRESGGRIDPTAGSAALMVGMREAIMASGYTRADLVALARHAKAGALERLVRGKGSRKTLTLGDLHGFNGDWSPLADAIVEAREAERRRAQNVVRPVAPTMPRPTTEELRAGIEGLKRAIGKAS